LAKKDRQLLFNLALGAAASLLAIGLQSLLRRSLGENLKSDERILLVASVVLLGICMLWLLVAAYGRAIKRFVEPRIREELRSSLEVEIRAVVEKESRELLEERTGITEIFHSFRACEKEIVAELKAANEIRVFLQVGRTILAGNANFYEQLAESIRPDTRVKILQADVRSPYLSERTAHERGSKYNVWLADLDHAVKKVETLAKNGKAKIEGRQHKEGYVWRLFLFDNCAYVQPYLHHRNNSELAPVLKLLKWRRGTENREENQNSLYKVFSSYFDLKWEENLPEVQRMEDIVTGEAANIVVAAVIRYHQFYVFAVPRRYIERTGREVPFHGVGGKRKLGEGLIEALERETGEEIGVRVSVTGSAKTRYLTTGAELEQVSLSNTPRPYCIYKRTRDADPNFAHAEVLWLVGYEAEANISHLDHLQPGAEIGALVVLTSDMLRKTLHDPVTYALLSKAADGSRVIVGEGVNFDMSRRAVPAGLATIVAAGELPRFLRRL
jgi:8-oxo-dGTP pyrophosphatase MutT (NUDIX family)